MDRNWLSVNTSVGNHATQKITVGIYRCFFVTCEQSFNFEDLVICITMYKFNYSELTTVFFVSFNSFASFYTDGNFTTELSKKCYSIFYFDNQFMGIKLKYLFSVKCSKVVVLDTTSVL